MSTSEISGTRLSSAPASVAPTMPAPTIAQSNLFSPVTTCRHFTLNQYRVPWQVLAQDLRALFRDQHLLNGLNVHDGSVTYKAVADVLGYEYVAPMEALKRA